MTTLEMGHWLVSWRTLCGQGGTQVSKAACPACRMNAGDAPADRLCDKAAIEIRDRIFEADRLQAIMADLKKWADDPDFFGCSVSKKIRELEEGEF